MLAGEWIKYGVFSWLIALETLFSGCSMQSPSRTGFNRQVAISAQSVNTGKTLDSFEGVASYYGGRFHGKPTASGEIYNQEAFTGAHRSLPFGTILQVTNISNQRSVKIRINDRGPFKPTRVIDLSVAAARELKMLESGVAKVRVEVIKER